MRTIYFYLILCLIANNIYSQELIDLVFVKEINNPAQNKFLEDHNISSFLIIYQQFYTTNERLDEQKLEKQIIERYPNKDATGFCVLDWEGKSMEAFKNPKNKKFQYYVNQFVKTLKFAKKLRPNVKWAFYHLPYISYWDNVKKGRGKNLALDLIFSNQDFIAPSLYVFFPEEDYWDKNIAYIKNNMEIALEIGYKYSKPVYPFIWHRAHPGNKKFANELLPPIFFKQTINQISSASYKNKRATGVFWWHCENYFYRNKDKLKSIGKEYLKVKHKEQYQYDIFEKYYQVLKPCINVN